MTHENKLGEFTAQMTVRIAWRLRMSLCGRERECLRWVTDDLLVI